MDSPIMTEGNNKSEEISARNIQVWGYVRRWILPNKNLE
jgi:hypothetical protein